LWGHQASIRAKCCDINSWHWLDEKANVGVMESESRTDFT